MEPQVPRLQKYKKNEIVKAIQAEGLDPRAFDLGENKTEAWIAQRHSTARFTIAGDAIKYVGQHRFGDWPAWPYEAYTWQGVMEKVEVWLGDLKSDLDTPDLWAELQSEAEVLRGAQHEETDNTLFTSSERAAIAQRLNELAQYVERTNLLSGGQFVELKDRVDYLVEATGRLGRIDWRNAFVGAILGYLLSAGIPPETARHLFSIFLGIISHIHGLPGLPGG
jgi:hypothetical protein